MLWRQTSAAQRWCRRSPRRFPPYGPSSAALTTLRPTSTS
ncbi:hypothetical protein Ahy_B02g061347 isoform D [Arachis hypogaea]|uniref:Uncharacterized protein n=1 Tax=Arachis hypogaea TaxID=3818 RepID=A0A445AKQ3_ARAHY|nr:hypothetical protein Ahy_B02g061347 isoform D [Arachis hypogaea]